MQTFLIIIGYIIVVGFGLMLTGAFIGLSVLTGFFGKYNIGGVLVTYKERILGLIFLSIIIGYWYFTYSSFSFEMNMKG